jgi:hypothetical protein
VANGPAAPGTSPLVFVREHTNCFAVLQRFDTAGWHLGTDVERVKGSRESGERDWVLSFLPAASDVSPVSAPPWPEGQ